MQYKMLIIHSFTVTRLDRWVNNKYDLFGRFCFFVKSCKTCIGDIRVEDCELNKGRIKSSWTKIWHQKQHGEKVCGQKLFTHGKKVFFETSKFLFAFFFKILTSCNCYMYNQYEGCQQTYISDRAANIITNDLFDVF